MLCDFGFAVKGREPVHNGGTLCHIPLKYLWDDQRGFPGDVWAFDKEAITQLGFLPLDRSIWQLFHIYSVDI